MSEKNELRVIGTIKEIYPDSIRFTLNHYVENDKFYHLPYLGKEATLKLSRECYNFILTSYSEKSVILTIKDELVISIAPLQNLKPYPQHLIISFPNDGVALISNRDFIEGKLYPRFVSKYIKGIQNKNRKSRFKFQCEKDDLTEYGSVGEMPCGCCSVIKVWFILTYVVAELYDKKLERLQKAGIDVTEKQRLPSTEKVKLFFSEEVLRRKFSNNPSGKGGQ